MLHPSLHKILFELQGPHTLQACFCGQPFPIISPCFTHAWELPRENYLPSAFAAAVQLLQSTPIPLNWQALVAPWRKSTSLPLVLKQPLQYNQPPDPAQQCTAAIEMHAYKAHNKLLLSALLASYCFPHLTQRLHFSHG